MHKLCRKCEEEKEVSEFHLNSTYKGGYSNKCKECVRKYDATRSVKYYHNGGAKERYQLAHTFINWIAIRQGCKDCNDKYRNRPEFLLEVNEGFIQHPESLTYDHIRGKKKFKISAWRGYSLNSSLKIQKRSMRRFQDELKKCEIVCHNHHSIRTKRDWHKLNKGLINKRRVEREKILND